MAKDKVKKKPSGYNLFIKKCMGEHADEMKGQPFGAAAPFMKQCTQDWKGLTDEQKATFKERSDKCELIDMKWECPEE